ncbi:hypothetical protein OROMI_003920 [Orobanche minor]
MSTKPQHDDEISEEEDNGSSYPYTATSARTNKFKVTVPVAPRFVCEEHLGRRKEYYTKLEEKHKALEKEKREGEARQKKEEEASIKELRKSMVIAKVLPLRLSSKRLPLTRPKSPKLMRRKSCGDAGKACCGERTARHRAAKGNERIGGRKSNASFKNDQDDPQEEEEHAHNEDE